MPQPAVKRAAHRDAKVIPLRKSATEWEQALAAFLTEKRRKNLSPSTLENYEWYLKGARMTAFVKDHAITSPAQMDAAMLSAFEAELSAVKPTVEGGKKLSASTIHTFHRVLQNFLGFCRRSDYGGDAKVREVEAPKLEQREPETFSDKDIETIREALKDRPRDLMMADLLLATGLRLQEICNLTLDDFIDPSDGRALIRVRQGKGRKDRYVPMDTPKNRLSDQLRRYIAKDRPKGPATALFLSTRADSRGGEPQPLSPNGIQIMFKRLSRETGIHVNPHKWRHSFATRSLSAGVDVMALQKALGHTTLQMVSKYVHYQTDDLIAAWGKRRD
jgi:site-specific recombinase XerD